MTFEEMAAAFDNLPSTKQIRDERDRAAACLVKNGFVYRREGDRFVNRSRRCDIIPSTRTARPESLAGPLDEVIESWVTTEAVDEHFWLPPRAGYKAEVRRVLKQAGMRGKPVTTAAHPLGLGWRWMLPGAVRAMSRALAAERKAYASGDSE